MHAINGTLGEDGRFQGRSGDSYVMLVWWDAQGQVHSYSIHQYGGATLDADSPHYADQAPLFARRELKPVWLDEPEIRQNLEREYRPGEQGSVSSNQLPIASPFLSHQALLTLPLTSIKVSQQGYFRRRDVYNWRLT